MLSLGTSINFYNGNNCATLYLFIDCGLQFCRKNTEVTILIVVEFHIFYLRLYSIHVDKENAAFLQTT